jgi:hypothetical protein
VATLGDTPQDRSIPISVSLPMKAKASRGWRFCQQTLLMYTNLQSWVYTVNRKGS